MNAPAPEEKPNAPTRERSRRDPTNLPRVSTPVVAAVLLAFLLVLAGLFALGYFPHRHRVNEAKEFAENQQDVPKVDVVQPARRTTAGDLVLPADTRAMQETSLFPRTSGYLKKLYVDIGDRVKAGQLLAEIETPEVDAQLNSARASLEQAKANVTKSEADLDLADKTVRRFESPAVANSVTPQDIDEKRSAFNQARAARDAARASVNAAQAEVQRLTELQSFEKVTAPFAGVITARNYDVGALMSAGNNSADGREMFRIAETDVLKVLANIPQTYVTSVKVGQTATLEVRNYPGRTF
jgi:RND family efflux transporter MFP subunit